MHRRHSRAKCKKSGLPSDFTPQKSAAPLCFLKLTIFAAHHKAGLQSEVSHKNQPVQYASSILNLQVVLTHPQKLNSPDERHLQWGRSRVSGHPAGLPAAATTKTNAFTSKQTSKDKGRKARQDSSPSCYQHRCDLCRAKSVDNGCQGGSSVVLRTGHVRASTSRGDVRPGAKGEHSVKIRPPKPWKVLSRNWPRREH